MRFVSSTVTQCSLLDSDSMCTVNCFLAHMTDLTGKLEHLKNALYPSMSITECVLFIVLIL